MRTLFFFIILLIQTSVFAQSFPLTTDLDLIPNLSQNPNTIGGGFVTDGGIMGGQIDYKVTNNNGTSLISIFNNTFFMGSNAIGNIEYVWDGVDDDEDVLSLNTSIADLGFCGTFTIAFSAPSFPDDSLNFDVTIELFNASGRYITWTGPVSLFNVPSNLIVNTSLFQTVGPGAFDFNDVRAFRIQLSTLAGDNLAADITSIDFTPNGQTGPSCAPILAPAPIPTLGQWSMLILLLISTILGSIYFQAVRPAQVRN